jgi:hypothetical protein
MRDRLAHRPTAAWAFATAAGTIAAVLLLGGPVLAQPGGMGATPLAVDLKKAPVGAWAEYQVAIGEGNAKARWALVGRSADNVVIEMAMDGGPAAQMGGKMTVALTLAPDPIKAERPVKKMVMQVEGKDPMEMPSEGPNHRFEKPDPKKLVGKETIKVPAGSFPTSHYRDSNERGTLDLWISETVPPLGVVKLQMTPKAGTGGGPAGPPQQVTMELSRQGKDAKPVITKAPKPFDPGALMGGSPGGKPQGTGKQPPVGPAPGGPPPHQ